MATDKKITELSSYSAVGDTDVVPIVDVVNGITKKTTWANFKSLLVTYFNTLYATITGVQTLTNKTLTAPILNAPVIVMGSDADGDILVRVGGLYARLPKGTALQNLRVNAGGTALEYYTVASAVNASSSVAGQVQLATLAQILAGTATGSTGAALAITPDQLILAQNLITLNAGETLVANQAVYEGAYNPTPVALDTDVGVNSTSWSGASTSLSQAITIGNNTNRYLIVFLVIAQGNGSSGNASVSSVSIGGNAMTLLQTDTSSGNVYMYGIANPPVGTSNITATLTASGGQFGTYSLVAYSLYNTSFQNAYKKAGTSLLGNNTLETSIALGFESATTSSGGTGALSSPQFTNNVLQPTSGGTCFASGGISNSIDTQGNLNMTSSGSGNISPQVVMMAVFSPSNAPTFGVARLTTAQNTGMGNFEKIMKFIGITIGSASAGSPVNIKFGAILTGLSGLTAGSIYYLDNTLGTFTTTGGDMKKEIGFAISTTSMLIMSKKTMSGLPISKITAIAYTAESDGFLYALGSGSIVVNAVTVAQSNTTSVGMFAPVFKGQSYTITTSGGQASFTPLL